MKQISESELKAGFSLESRSNVAWFTFSCGLAGVIISLIILGLLQNYFTEMKELLDEADGRLISPELKNQVDNKTEAFGKLVAEVLFPLFLTANLLWVAGGFAWAYDFKRNPRNRFLWKTGGLLVLLTAATCCLWWAFLISRYLEGPAG